MLHYTMFSYILLETYDVTYIVLGLYYILWVVLLVNGGLRTEWEITQGRLTHVLRPF